MADDRDLSHQLARIDRRLKAIGYCVFVGFAGGIGYLVQDIASKIGLPTDWAGSAGGGIGALVGSVLLARFTRD